MLSRVKIEIVKRSDQALGQRDEAFRLRRLQGDQRFRLQVPI
jgi:hypothetical protein